METTTITLRPRPPFAWNLTLEFLGDFGPLREEHRIEGGALRKALMAGGQAVLAEIADAGTEAEPALRCTLTADALPPQLVDEAAGALGRFLSMDDDLGPLYELAAGDPPFAAVVRQLHGYHQVRFSTPFEAACWAILTQRNMLAIAYPMKLALVDHIGNGLTVGGTRFRAFPLPEQVAALDPEDVQRIVGHSQKGPLLHGVALAFAAADDAWLRAAPTDEVAAWLRSIKGVGAWSENFILLRGLGRMDQLPLDNKWLDQAVERIYGRGASGRTERVAARYGSWQGYWAHYLRLAD
ncbi:MAG TPA: hypothetical protein VGE07_19330 [Herpetosiphonaceae bacterium]